MAEVSIRRMGNLGIMTVRYGENFEFSDRYPVLPERPAGLVRVGPTYEIDGHKVATGDRLLNGAERSVGWFVSDEEAAEIARQFAEALAGKTFPVIG